MGWLVSLLKPIASWVLYNLFERFVNAVKDYYAEKARKEAEELENKRATAEYFKVISNPEATREERKSAEDKFLNS